MHDNLMRVIEELKLLALDLSWSWDWRLSELFSSLDPELWLSTGRNPVLLLARLGPDGVERALERPRARAALEQARRSLRPGGVAASRPWRSEARLEVAYFSLEFGLADCLPIYSGGLGILAGDHLKAASELNLPLVGVGLLYRQGFGHQRLDQDGRQIEEYPATRFEDLPLERVTTEAGPLTVHCPVGANEVQVAVWKAQVGRTPLYLLDTDLDSNPPESRAITDRLYVPEADRRLRQECVLGIGGMRALRALGIEPTVFHMNEGHGFLVSIERMRELRAARELSWEEARLLAGAGFVFTTHTPVAAGSDYFSAELVQDVLGGYLGDAGLDLEGFMDLGRRQAGDPTEDLCTTYVGLRMADHSVGVSRLHGTVSRRLWKDAWPGIVESQVPISSVTNGVHLRTWLAPDLARMLEQWVDPRWWELEADDERWRGLRSIPDAELWSTHQRLRARLVELVNRNWATARLDPHALTIGFGRRFAPYKRADLLIRNPERLEAILCRRDRPVQFIFAGKAHPADEPGKAILQAVVRLARGNAQVGFLEDYAIEVARPLVQGADVWLNNPRRFLEASGTSGMKAAANGVLNLSVLDGWWDEGYRPDSGWAIPSGATLERPETDDAAEAESLFRILEREVVPNFYARDHTDLPTQWVAMMRASMLNAATAFSARRMLCDYLDTCYAPAAERSLQLALLSEWDG